MLRVTGRRADGYHEIQTVFQFLDWGDELDFRIRQDGLIRRHGEVPGVSEDQDLAVRAARLLREAAGISPGADIHIAKRIPLGGGLGGGSSDAATVLVALNRLWGVGYSTQRLASLALTLGADVPVFVHGRAAWAEGVGERLTPLELTEPWYLVIQPDCAVPTAAVFGDPQLTRNSPPITIADFLSAGGANDCEPVVRRSFAPVAEALGWLSSFAKAQLSGTGACVFAAFADSRAAWAVLRRLPAGWRGFVARGRNRSSVLDRMAR